MKYLFNRSLLTLLCTSLSCLTISSAFAANHNEGFLGTKELAESLPWDQANGYHQDDAYLYRIHQNAYSHLFAFSDTGDVVQLHDASKWSVRYSHRQTVLQWVQSDNLFIKPCTSCFSSYKFVLYNLTTHQTAEVNLIKPPLPMGAQTFRIVNIEPNARLVQLSDNTVWQVDYQDQTFPYWQINQRLLIGVNNYWRSAPFPHILINVDMHKEPYSQADFYGYPTGY